MPDTTDDWQFPTEIAEILPALRMIFSGENVKVAAYQEQ